MHNMAPVTAEVCLVDLTAAAPPTSPPQPAAPMHDARIHLGAVLLPDRTALVTGGAAAEGTPTAAALDAEIFDPTTPCSCPTGGS